MNKKLITTAFILSFGLVGCDSNEVGDVSLGFFTLKDKHTFTNTITQQF
ncbi:hypothetical protein [Vibrio ordalii]